jgi:hypothetical protein
MPGEEFRIAAAAERIAHALEAIARTADPKFRALPEVQAEEKRVLREQQRRSS